MNERSIFMEALERDTADQRSSFLDEVCAGDTALRQRVEALLQSHEQAGEFMGRPAPERLVQELNNTDKVGETRAEDAPADDNESDALGFLTPSDKPGVLGRLDHYEILDIVGRGGMGVVLRAFDETLHRVVAIKVMAAQLASSDPARKRFTREAQAAAAVSHDHVVTIHAVEHGPSPYMVMQYVPGVSLQQRLDREGPLPVEDIVRIGMQTASGLAAAHALGLIHRDIKPANILLEKGGDRVKITDFGMARAAADASLTRTGVVTGTPQYMAPEQARAGQLDARTDLFSLGSVLYAMCTGRPPFRAQGSLAILKRVCEEAPSPIRDTNPEIPEWLVAIIEKLQAKDPAQRYQSAAEVAELLNGHLTQLMHASPRPVSAGKAPDTAISTRNSSTGLQPSLGKRRRWRLAAACVLLLVGGLYLEAAGVTDLSGTVLRILTPDGTLVVEVDPGVKVTVEGDDGLVITGAGLEEIYLRPGSYRVQADKNGKPVSLETEQVTISTGGRQVVRVKLEALPAAATAKAAMSAFVLLTAGKERNYETLAEAVQNASDGDTIEVRGDGPFETEPIDLGKKALAIRAGPQTRPVLMRKPTDAADAVTVLATAAPLVLEGLTFIAPEMELGAGKDGVGRGALVSSRETHLFATHCRFVSSGATSHLLAIHPLRVEVRDCAFLGHSWHSVGVNCKGSAAVRLRNNVLGVVTVFVSANAPARDVTVVLEKNTLAGPMPPVDIRYSTPGKLVIPARPPLHVVASDNVIAGKRASAMLVLQTDVSPSADEATAVLKGLLRWEERRNVHDGRLLFSKSLKSDLNDPSKWDVKRWVTFWGLNETDVIAGEAHFAGDVSADLLIKNPISLTPADFRLRSGSAGYRAGKDDKDLGADVDLVGPGPAYERWKKTAAYQEWLTETGQITTPKPQPFVVLGAKGSEARRYDTLAEAVQNANIRETIEIRGDGPFESEPINVKKAMVIRAGEGFRPVIKLSAEGIQNKLPLLSTNAALVLEGLELQRAC